MSIQGEIDRLSAAKASIAASLQAMGIEPPEGTTLEQYAAQLAAIATAAPWLSIPGGGTMQMGESLGEGPYTIEVTEDGEGGDLLAEQVGYSNTGSGLEATNVQEAIDELAGKGGGEYLPLTGGTMQGDITIPADKAIKHGGSAAQIKMMPNGNIRIEAPLAEGAAAITVGTSGINLVNNTTQVLHTSESGVALKANTDMTGHKIANLAAPSDPADAANKQYVDEHAGARVILGSYVGTGTHGASNPNHITLAEPFKLLCIYGIQHTDSYTSISDSDICNIIPSSIIPTEYTSGFGFGMGYNYNPRDTYGKKSADGKTFSWYYDLSPSGAESVQFNQSGTVYHYYAIV